MPQGDTILAVDYNQIRNTVKNILGKGSGNFGYGKKLQSREVTSATDIILAADWDLLRLDITRIREHQTGNKPSIIDVAQAQLVEFNFKSQYNDISLVGETERNLIGTGQSRTDPVTTVSTTAAWSSLATHTVTVTFTASGQGPETGESYSGADSARWFFNSGGTINFSAARSGGITNAQNASWSTLLANIGTVRIGFQEFYALTNQDLLLFSQTANSPYNQNSYIVKARSNIASNANGGATIIQFTVEFADNYSSTVSDAIDGTLTSTITCTKSEGVLPVSSPSFTFSQLVTTGNPVYPVAQAAIAPTQKTYASFNKGGTTTTETFTITNAGTADLVISNIQYSNGDATVTEYPVYSWGPSPGVTIPPTQINGGPPGSTGFKTFTLRYTSSSAGLKNNTFTVFTNVTNVTVSTSFTVTQASLSVTPSSLSISFFEGTTATRTITVLNTGSGPLDITSVNFVNDSSITQSSDFSGAWGGSTATSILAGSSKSFTVTYGGTSLGVKNCSIIINSDVGSSTIPVSVTVNPYLAQISVSPATLSYSLSVGGSDTKTVTVSNTGQGVLQIAEVTLSNPGLTGNVSWDSFPFTIAVNGSRTLSISYSGSSSGNYQPTVAIRSNSLSVTTDNIFTISNNVSIAAAPVAPPPVAPPPVAPPPITPIAPPPIVPQQPPLAPLLGTLDIYPDLYYSMATNFDNIVSFTVANVGQGPLTITGVRVVLPSGVTGTLLGNALASGTTNISRGDLFQPGQQVAVPLTARSASSVDARGTLTVFASNSTNASDSIQMGFNIRAPILKPTMTASWSPSSGTGPRTATLTWSATNAQAVFISSSLPGFNGTYPVSGSKAYNFPSAGGSDNTLVVASGEGGEFRINTNVNISAAPVPPPVTRPYVTGFNMTVPKNTVFPVTVTFNESVRLVDANLISVIKPNVGQVRGAIEISVNGRTVSISPDPYRGNWGKLPLPITITAGAFASVATGGTSLLWQAAIQPV